MPQLQKTAAKDRKVISVGMTQLLTQSHSMLSEPFVKAWCVVPSASGPALARNAWLTLFPPPPSVPPFLPSFVRLRAHAARPATMDATLGLLLLPQDLTTPTAGSIEDDLGTLDPEDAGFQASFAKLGASEAAVREDPASHVTTDEKTFLRAELTRLGGQVGPLLQQVNAEALSRLQS